MSEKINKKIEKMNVNKESDKDVIDQIFKHKFFVTQVNYPPQNGFLEYGPIMTVVKNGIIDAWRKKVIDDNMFELDTSVMVPYDVLKNSGHIDKFCDVVLTDGIVTVRADHYIEEKVGEWHNIPNSVEMSTFVKLEEIKALLNKKAEKQFDQKTVEEICAQFECTKKNLAECSKLEIDWIVKVNNLRTEVGEFLPSKDFNLIFKLNDGQYMRPELAQGIFVNFRKAYDFNNGQMPFACYTIGKSYRNEISARGGMFRTKEFYQAEIEYFTEDGSHENFMDKEVQNESLLFLPNKMQTPVEKTIKEAVECGIISSEAICVFLVRCKWFLQEIGIDMSTVRFRQHHSNEMAHYACDCWDLEIRTLNGWIECAGIAHRGNFDLSVHGKTINTSAKKCIKAFTVKELEIDKKAVIKGLKEKFSAFEEFVKSIESKEFENKETHEVEFEAKKYILKVVEKTIDSVNYIPMVIEPSFGISRIMYALVEQKFCLEEKRNVLKLKPKLSFKHVVVTGLLNNDQMNEKAKEIKSNLQNCGLVAIANTRNVSIGKKYLTCDEMGIPFVVTIDQETEKSNLVTVRDRDTATQIQIGFSELGKVLKDIVDEKLSWNEIYETHKFVKQ